MQEKTNNMTAQEYGERLRQLAYVCGMNQRYHQKLKQFWAVVDKTIRIFVGILAVLAAVFAVPPLDTPWISLGVAIAAAFLAIALNIIPVGDWEKTHAELFRLWSDLRKDAEQQAVKTCDLSPNATVENHLVERVCEFTGKEHALDATEPAPIRWLLRRCQEDENQSRYGRRQPGTEPESVAERTPQVITS